jgi:hypothetical protein
MAMPWSIDSSVRPRVRVCSSELALLLFKFRDIRPETDRPAVGTAVLGDPYPPVPVDFLIEIARARPVQLHLLRNLGVLATDHIRHNTQFR